MVLGDRGIADAKALAVSEAAFLRSSTGAVPAARVASDSSTVEDSSIAYQAGRLIGTACSVGLVIFLIRNGKKRRDEREAYKARMATPPPEFYVRPPTPFHLTDPRGLAFPHHRHPIPWSYVTSTATTTRRFHI